jgi:hypothetical protein
MREKLRPGGANAEPLLRNGKSNVRSFSRIAEFEQSKNWRGRT